MTTDNVEPISVPRCKCPPMVTFDHAECCHAPACMWCIYCGPEHNNCYPRQAEQPVPNSQRGANPFISHDLSWDNLSAPQSEDDRLPSLKHRPTRKHSQ